MFFFTFSFFLSLLTLPFGEIKILYRTLSRERVGHKEQRSTVKIAGGRSGPNRNRLIYIRKFHMPRHTNW